MNKDIGYLNGYDIKGLLEQIYNANKIIIENSEFDYDVNLIDLVKSINTVTCDDLYKMYEKSNSVEFLKLIFNNLSRLLKFMLGAYLNIYALKCFNNDSDVIENIKSLYSHSVDTLATNNNISEKGKNNFLNLLVSLKVDYIGDQISELKNFNEETSLNDFVNFYVGNNILSANDNLYFLLYKQYELEQNQYEIELNESDLLYLLKNYYDVVQEIAYKTLCYKKTKQKNLKI